MASLPSTPDPDSCYRALTARDARFDGLFFTGVRSTGIYCRPVCRARTPHRAGCEFFCSAAAAEKAGYRPCLLCRPELAPYPVAESLAAGVARLIAEGAMAEGGVPALAHRAGLSERQLRRVIQQQYGVSPIELDQTCRLLFAKKLLQETSLPLAQLAHAAGFGSVRRFNALFSQRYGLAPGRLRRSGAEGEPGPAQQSVVLKLAYRPPLPWQQLLGYLAPRALPGVEQVLIGDEASWTRTVSLDGCEGWIRASHDEKSTQLRLEIASTLLPVLQPLVARTRQVFDLDANPAAVRQQLAADPLLAPVLARLPGLRLPGTFAPFELAIRAVLGQQVSVAGATTLCARLIARFGEPARTPFAPLSRHFPTAQRLAALAPDELATIGLPLRRAQTLVALAVHARDHGLLARPGMALDEAVASLCALPGIGLWTAHYVALRGLGYTDAFPAGDLGLQKAVAALQAGSGSARMRERELAQRAAAWSPWRGYAAMALWQGMHLDTKDSQ